MIGGLNRMGLNKFKPNLLSEVIYDYLQNKSNLKSEKGMTRKKPYKTNKLNYLFFSEHKISLYKEIIPLLDEIKNIVFEENKKLNHSFWELTLEEYFEEDTRIFTKQRRKHYKGLYKRFVGFFLYFYLYVRKTLKNRTGRFPYSRNTITIYVETPNCIELIVYCHKTENWKTYHGKLFTQVFRIKRVDFF